ncbi:hypothetical protein [Streptomyces chryseus]|uniref:Uncharacterized protein n=1 Tax=Streptomyces chryseus TaxID=68186 RepID=A0ABQ3DMY9_9ACTN|nr:hypothetical protein [Streptomyces chryseus]GHB05870.1 hypothetical protein GCM10010346_31310 [Streptomyces chryseus]
MFRPFYAVAGEVGQEAAARILARRMLAGELTPRGFTGRIHQRYGHDLALTERIAELDDVSCPAWHPGTRAMVRSAAAPGAGARWLMAARVVP